MNVKLRAAAERVIDYLGKCASGEVNPDDRVDNLWRESHDLAQHYLATAREDDGEEIRKLPFQDCTGGNWEAWTKMGLFAVRYDHNFDRGFCPTPWKTFFPAGFPPSNMKEHGSEGRMYLLSGNREDAMKKAQAIYDAVILEALEGR